MKRLALTLILAACTSSVSAQTPPCESLNDQNTTVTMNVTQFGFGGPNGNAWQFTPANNGVVLAGQFYTENTALTGDRFMSIEIWSDVGGAPGARLAGGTWRISAALGAAWQGANLDAQVFLISGQPVWIAWIDPGFSVLPIEPGGAPVISATLSGGSWALTGNMAEPKIRLFCNLLDDTQTSVFGLPCPGSTSGIGTLFTNQQPAVGNSDFQFEGTGFQPGRPVFLALGVNQSWVSIPVPGLGAGCMQHTDIVASAFGVSGTGNQQGPTAMGHVRFSLPIPNDPGLVGLFLSAQLAGADPGLGTPLSFSVSNGLRITVF